MQRPLMGEGRGDVPPGKLGGRPQLHVNKELKKKDQGQAPSYSLLILIFKLEKLQINDGFYRFYNN